MSACEIDGLLQEIRSAPDCSVLPPSGRPLLPDGLNVPDDLAYFYERCGGVELFAHADFPIAIVAPDAVRSSNLVILGETDFGDRSDEWFIIAATPDGEYVSIDLNADRVGRCYDSFHEVHGLVGDSKVVATSFTDLLVRLVGNGGRHWYWVEPDFVDLGDAYDADAPRNS